MSSRRSRFKVAASIPVRRKAGVVDPKDDPKNQSEAGQGSDVALKEESGLEHHDTVVETKTIPEENVSTPSTVSIPEPKPTFKRIHPPVQAQIKRECSRTTDHDTTDDRIGSSQVLPAQDDPHLSSSGDKGIEYAVNIGIESCSTQPDRNEEAASSILNLSITSQQTEERPVTPSPSSVPVPSSPAKSLARPRFVRPALVDAGVRRHSVHASSASESEDEARRNQISRTRKVSESSSVVRNPAVTTLVPVATSVDTGASECARLALLPKRKRPKISNFVRKIAEARRDFNKKFAREKPDRSNLKMFDLIFYNPQTASMGGPNTKARRKPEEKITPAVQDEISERIDEENEDEPDRVEDPQAEGEGELEVAMPAPRVKIGANGEIILDEKSLMIETTEARKGREALLNSVPVFESGNKKISYYGKKHTRFKDWSPIETKCFYKALNSIGTDFAMMQSLFPDRTRGELKNKFKREERVNAALIDAAISRPSEFNLLLLKEEIDRERALVEQETKRKMDEKLQKEHERRQQLAARKTERSDDISWAGLKQFIGHQVDDDKPKTQARRSRRGASRRKLCADYVDPFEVDDRCLDEANNSDDTTGHRGKENDVELPPPKQKRVTKKRQPEFSTATDFGESSDNLSSEERSLNRPKGSKNVVKNNKRKRQKNDSITVYYPDELGGSDCESVASSINIPGRTEEIGDDEFVELIKQNMQKLESATIRVQAPSPSCGKQGKIRVVLDVPPSPSTSPALKRTHITTNMPVSRTFKVESHIKTNRVELRKCTDTVRDVVPNKVFHSSKIQSVNSSEAIEKEPAMKCENTEENEINPGPVEDMETETVFTFPSPVQRTLSREVLETRKVYKENDFDTCQSVQTTQSLAPEMDLPLDYRTSITKQQEPVHYRKSPIQDNLKSNWSPEEQDDRKEEEEEEPFSSQSLIEQESSVVERSDAPSVPVEGRSTDEDLKMNYRMTGGLQYALIEAGTDPEQKRTYLAGLRPGTFVFMSTEAPHMPLERRCSMFMIAETISPNGGKQFTPMPVVLPPELMKLITQELNCS